MQVIPHLRKIVHVDSFVQHYLHRNLSTDLRPLKLKLIPRHSTCLRSAPLMHDKEQSSCSPFKDYLGSCLGVGNDLAYRSHLYICCFSSFRHESSYSLIKVYAQLEVGHLSRQHHIDTNICSLFVGS